MLFYITCLRSILEYACPVFHRALPGYLSEDLERLQKRALQIIYPGMSYNQALEFSGMPTLFKSREEISSKLFNEVVGDTELIKLFSKEESEFCLTIMQD